MHNLCQQKHKQYPLASGYTGRKICANVTSVNSPDSQQQPYLLSGTSLVPGTHRHHCHTILNPLSPSLPRLPPSLSLFVPYPGLTLSSSSLLSLQRSPATLTTKHCLLSEAQHQAFSDLSSPWRISHHPSLPGTGPLALSSLAPVTG